MNNPQSISRDPRNEGLHWENCRCERCGAEESEWLFDGPDRLQGLPGIFRQVKCRNCGTYRQDPRLQWQALAAYYPGDYAAYEFHPDDQTNRLKKFIRNFGNLKRRRQIEKFQPGGTILEVGFGTGGFVRELQETGRWKVEGLEPNEAAATYVEQTTGIRVFKDTLDHAMLDEEYYDAVVMWCVLEHLYHPIDDLKKIFRILKPGGWVFFSVPNCESLGKKVFGKYWAGWDLPRHLNLFPDDVMAAALREIGFGEISRRCISNSYHTLGHSLDFWTQGFADTHPRVRQALTRIYYSLGMRLALLAPLWLLEQMTLTTNVTYFARKPVSHSAASHTG